MGLYTGRLQRGLLQRVDHSLSKISLTFAPYFLAGLGVPSLVEESSTNPKALSPEPLSYLLWNPCSTLYEPARLYSRRLGGLPTSLRLPVWACGASWQYDMDVFRKFGVPYFRFLITRILLFRVLHQGPPIFRKLPSSSSFGGMA